MGCRELSGSLRSTGRRSSRLRCSRARNRKSNSSSVGKSDESDKAVEIESLSEDIKIGDLSCICGSEVSGIGEEAMM